MLITAGADSSVRLWDVEKGTELCKWDTHQPARSCCFAQADQRLAAYTTSAFATVLPSIRFIRIADVPGDSDRNPILQIDIERTQAYDPLLNHADGRFNLTTCQLLQCQLQHPDGLHVHCPHQLLWTFLASRATRVSLILGTCAHQQMGLRFGTVIHILSAVVKDRIVWSSRTTNNACFHTLASPWRVLQHDNVRHSAGAHAVPLLIATPCW